MSRRNDLIIYLHFLLLAVSTGVREHVINFIVVCMCVFTVCC